MDSKIGLLKQRLYDINALEKAGAILSWDQEILMPKKGGSARAQQLGILSRMAHEQLVADSTQNLVDQARSEIQSDSVEEALIRVTQRKIDQATKLPGSLVEKKARLTAEAHQIWAEAREQSNFKKFQPSLEAIIEIVQEEANCLGYKDHIYDPLIDIYEEGATAADCKNMFDSVKPTLVQLVKDIKENGKTVDDSKLYGNWTKEQVMPLLSEILEDIKYDFNRGRLDTAVHPFCTNFAVNDVRITTRFLDHISSSLLSTMHEAGHAHYELGIPNEWDGLPLASGVSLGVHESQSRLWENIIGKSKSFWKYYLPKLQQLAPELLDMNLEEYYCAINKVTPSFIRVESDELTYNLHVLIRFELECDMLTNKLAIKDLPQAWNDKMNAYLGVTPPNDAQGCLQDMHWSGGNIGYFPTYTMGNLLSYQIWNILKKDISHPNELIEKSQFEPILDWLTENIYQHGSRYTPKNLIKRVTGKNLDPTDYLNALTAKYSEIYQLESVKC